jgi:hypothetical protein
MVDSTYLALPFIKNVFPFTCFSKSRPVCTTIFKKPSCLHHYFQKAVLFAPLFSKSRPVYSLYFEVVSDFPVYGQI